MNATRRCAECGRDVDPLSLTAPTCPYCGGAFDSLPTTLSIDAVEDGTTGSDAPQASTRSAFKAGDIFAERYRIVSRLGHGGMGDVYRADDLRIQQTVALKFVILDGTSQTRRIERFVREVRLARQITHPNVCRVYDIGESNSYQYFSMEYIDGEDLKTLLARVGHLPANRARDIARQLCAGLSAAHERQVLHLDLKPANIMLDARGRAVITDFGVARTSEQAVTRTLAGTPAYMAPEQLTGGPLTTQTDLYALGLVMYEMFTGHRPRDSGSRADDPDRLTPPSSFAPDIDPLIDQVTLACLSRDISSRPRSALAVASALRDREPDTIESSRDVTPHVRETPSGWLRVLVCALLLGMILLPVSAGAPLTPLPARKRLVVQPFTVAGGDVTHQAFCEGLGQALLSSLMTLNGRGGLELIQPDSVRPPDANLQMRGRCDRHGEIVDVAYAIDDVATHRQMRRDRVWEAAGSSLAIQRRLIDSVVRQLGLPADSLGSTTERPTNPAAFDAYLAGRRALMDYDRPENVEKAIAAFTQALTIDGTFASAQAGLGEAHRRHYEATREPAWIESGRQACQAAIRLQPLLAAAHICLGDLDNVTGDYEAALGEFRRALGLEPASDDAHRGIAYALERLGRVGEAEQTYREAIRLRPEYWAGYSWLATFLHRQGRYGEAAEQFGFALALSPENVRVRRSRGAIYVLMGRFEEGIADFEAANALRPTGEGFTNLGLAYFNLHQFDQAVRALEEASRRGPRDFSLLASLGDAYDRLPDRQAKAKETYRQALDLAATTLSTDARNGWTHVRAASVYAALHDRPHALEHLRKGIALAHDDNECAFFVGVTYARLGDHDQAFEWLRKAIAGGYSRAEIRTRVDFDRLHDDPRFTALVAAK